VSASGGSIRGIHGTKRRSITSVEREEFHSRSRNQFVKRGEEN